MLARKFIFLLVGVALNGYAFGACGTIPSDYPVLGSTQIGVASNSTISNGTTRTITPSTRTAEDAVNQASGSFVAWTPILPDMPVTTFPSNSSTTDKTSSSSSTMSVSSGSYRTVTANVNSNSSTSVQFNGGSATYINKLVVKSGSSSTTNDVKFAPGDYYIGTLDIGQYVRLKASSSSGVVRIFIDNSSYRNGSAGAFGSNLSINSGGNTSNWQMYLFPGGQGSPRTFAFSGPTTVNGLLYAPGQYDTVSFGSASSSGKNTITGAVLTAGTLTLGSYTDISYSSSTKTSIGSINTCFSFPLTAKFSMDEQSWSSASGQVIDSSGKGYNATAVNGVYTISYSPAVPGNPGSCSFARFTGNTKYIAMPSSFPNLGGNNFTVAAWIRTTNNSTSGQRIFTDNANGTGWYFSLGDPGQGRLRFYNNGLSSSSLDTSNNVISNNTWYFVAAVADVSNQKRTIHVFDQSGALINTTGPSSYSNSWSTDSGTAAIGGEATTSTSKRFLGDIDEVYVIADKVTASDLSTVAMSTRPCSAYFDHMAVIAPTTASTCAPAAITLIPHTALDGAISNWGGNIKVTTSDGKGDWSVITGTSGNLNNGTSNDGMATYTFAPGESSVVLGLSHGNPGTVSINVFDGSTNQSLIAGTPSLENANQTVFSSGGLSVVDGSGNPVAISTLTSGQTSTTYYLQANSSNCSTPLVSSTQNVEMLLECNNPGACLTPARINSTNLSVGIPNGGAQAGWASVPLVFNSSGRAPFTVKYGDAGKVKLYFRHAGQGITGSSNSFVVKPASFAITQISRKSDGAPNPGANGPSGVKFVKAGEEFQVTVSALDINDNPTPNFGNESPFVDIELLPSLVSPSGGSVPSLGGRFARKGEVGGYANNGVSVGTFTWNEVGVIAVQPHVLGGDYLGGGDVTGPASGNIGRFYLGKFIVDQGGIENRSDICPGSSGCPASFTYIGEPATLKFSLIPSALDGTPVKNYIGQGQSGEYSKFNPTNFAALNIALLDTVTTAPIGFAQPPYNLSARVSNSGLGSPACAATPCFSYDAVSGVVRADVSAKVYVTRGAQAEGPYTSATFGIAPTDSDGSPADGVSSPACNNPSATDCYNMDVDANNVPDHVSVAPTYLAYGRFKIGNSIGSEMLPLNLPFAAQYWDWNAGGVYVNNALDFQTSVISGNVTLSGWTTTAPKNLPSGSVSVNGGPFTAAAGIGLLQLTSPGSGKHGSVNVSIGASPAWLPSVSGKATFGAYHGPREIIYMRENF